MDTGSLAGLDWRALILVTLIAGGLVWAFVFFLRRNKEDLDSLEKAIEGERKEDGE